MKKKKEVIVNHRTHINYTHSHNYCIVLSEHILTRSDLFKTSSRDPHDWVGGTIWTSWHEEQNDDIMFKIP